MESAISAFVEAELQASRAVITALSEDQHSRALLLHIAETYITCLQGGGKLLFAGNGGSAADAQHIAGELVSRFQFDRPGLAALALSTDSSILTAIGNDYGYDRVFARQIEALGRPGDVVTLLSTSGNSPNILAAATRASQLGLRVIGLTGASGGKLAALCDLVLCAPSPSTPRIQECHLASYHLLCALVEARLFGRLRGAT